MRFIRLMLKIKRYGRMMIQKPYLVAASGLQVNRDSLFEHQGSIYLLGQKLKGSGATRIYKSSDNGASWITAIFSGAGGQDAPSHVAIVDGPYPPAVVQDSFRHLLMQTSCRNPVGH